MVDRNTRVRASQILNGDLNLDDMADAPKLASISYILDGGGVEILTGLAGDLEIPFKCQIQSVTLLADQTGSIVVDILKGTFGTFPPVTSITSSSKPTITSSNKSQDVTLTGWATVINAGDVLRYNIDSVSTIEKCSVSLKVIKIL